MNSPESLLQQEVTALQGIKGALDVLTSKVGELEEAFPDGPQKHREAHEAMIAARRAEAAFWTELKLDIAKKGIWGLLIIICGLIIVGIQIKFAGGIR